MFRRYINRRFISVSKFLYFIHNVNLQMNVLDGYNVTFIVLHQSYRVHRVTVHCISLFLPIALHFIRSDSNRIPLTTIDASKLTRSTLIYRGKKLFAYVISLCRSLHVSDNSLNNTLILPLSSNF